MDSASDHRRRPGRTELERLLRRMAAAVTVSAGLNERMRHYLMTHLAARNLRHPEDVPAARTRRTACDF